MEEAEIIQALKKVDLFAEFKVEALTEMVRACSLRELKANELLFDFGSPGTSLYIVLKGQLLIFRNARTIAALGPNECIGEMAVIDDKPRSAAAQATQPSTLLEISSEIFYRYLGNDPHALERMLHKVIHRLRNLTEDTQHAYEAVNMLVHDMLNMVTILEGAWIVKSSLPEGDERRIFLESIEKAQESLEAMMRHALRQARNLRTPYEKAATAPDELVRECLAVDIARHRDVQKVQVEVDAPGPLRPVSCNAVDLRRVIANLVINGAQAMGSSGGRIRISVRQDDARTRIAVEDNGRGISPENLARIFEPHFTTKVDGNGLGLSSCKEIVERLHQGRLTCTSTLGKGTTFTCEIPNAS